MLEKGNSNIYKKGTRSLSLCQKSAPSGLKTPMKDQKLNSETTWGKTTDNSPETKAEDKVHTIEQNITALLACKWSYSKSLTLFCVNVQFSDSMSLARVNSVKVPFPGKLGDVIRGNVG